MTTYSSTENKLIEELYITLQLIVVLLLLNIAFPMFGEAKFTSMTLFVTLFTLYVAGKIGVYINRTVFRNLELSESPNRLITLLDGLFLSWFVYLEWANGNNLLSVFYVYVLIQGVRYQGRSPWIFGLMPAGFHIAVITFGMHESLFQLEHMVEIIMYFVIAWCIEVPFRQIKSLHDERQYYYDELQKKNQALEKMATTDYLTTLSNHQSFYTYFDELRRHSVRKNFPISLTLIDIDNFKVINDTYGHLTGDQILKELAEIVKGSIRKTDFAARYGGEEFALIFPNTELDTALKLSERIRCAVEANDFMVGDQCIKVTISSGVSTFKPEGRCKCLYQFINNVDQLLYQAKRNGKNQIRYSI